MKNEKVKVLAINPGSKYLGLAVFKNTELVNWAIKKLRSKGMTHDQVLEKVAKILERLVSEYQPDFMAIGKPALNQSKNSPLLRAIIAKIKEARKMKVKRIYSFSVLKVRKYICRDEKVTKMNQEKIIVTQYYPWLYHRYEKDRKNDEKGQWWKRKYHSTLFDAVALGIYCYQKLNKRAFS
jgi:RNase H-fold protein (predicted Holliday junction resolvase)